uniref:Uncharacterized protein n=1 Tax=Oryza rufipogon TaxID=4529 RepID=A0A0E0N597_ORYRU
MVRMAGVDPEWWVLGSMATPGWQNVLLEIYGWMRSTAAWGELERGGGSAARFSSGDRGGEPAGRSAEAEHSEEGDELFRMMTRARVLDLSLSTYLYMAKSSCPAP